LTINPKDKVGLIGRNGSGKSTFLKLLLREQQPDSGTIEYDDGYTIGYLSQHIHFTKQTVLEEVTQVLPPEREYEEWKGEKILLGLGFAEEDLIEDPAKFSGGNQVKINLAKILLQEPDLLLLDEPTNYLDIYAIRWLEGFLKKWRGELILITHDRSFMDSVINHTVIIHRGKLRKIRGATGKIREQIAVEEDIYEKTRIREEDKRKVTEDWIKRFGAKASKASAAQSRQKQLDKMEERPALAKLDSLDFKFSHQHYNGGAYMVEVEKLKFHFIPEKPLIHNLSFNVSHGDKICIIGKNGNGKSTLLKLIYGELQALEGTVSMSGKVSCGYFGQTNIEHLNPENSICQELETVETDKPLEYSTIRRTCAQMMFPGDLAHKKISVLSGGEKSRVMLGKILLSPANILLLDEPTNHFDIESCESLMEAIQEFPGAVLMVTHDEHFLKNIANKLVIFDGGKTFIFEGTYESFLSKIGWKE
jgi:ATP-binding cassette, subfamily F, member 3